MIKFLRNIRQNLLNQGKTTKYFKYAIGEIILVVVGILIALQINNWNQERQNRNRELLYINNLIGDLESDSLMLSFQFDVSQRGFNFGVKLDSLLEVKDLGDLNPAMVIDSAQMVPRVWMPDYNNNTYLDLINTGNMSLIQNDSISRYIREYYENLPTDWNRIFDERCEELRKIMTDVIPLKFHVAELSDFMQGDSREFDPQNVLTEEEARSIFKAMTEYPEIRFHVKNVTRGLIFHMRLVYRVREGISLILDDLRNYRSTLVKN